MTEEQIKEAAYRWAKKMSNAPDKETPDWIMVDFMGGVEWAVKQFSFQPYDPEHPPEPGEYVCLCKSGDRISKVIDTYTPEIPWSPEIVSHYFKLPDKQ